VMNAQGQLLESYTRGVGLAGDIGTIVAVTHHAGSGVTPRTYYVRHNHRGDVIITRSGTTTVGSYDYSAFGNLKSSIGNDICRFKFSSKERDLSSGLYYYGYRFYSPQWQRWISRDPIGEAGGVNLYSFTLNSPTASFDIDGRFFLSPPFMWPLKGLCGLVTAIIAKGKYTNMRHLHCMASCQIARRCGIDTSIVLGIGKEFYDLGVCLATGDQRYCDSAFQPTDFKDNARGLCPTLKSCDELCASLENAPEGPPGPFSGLGRK